MASSSILGTLGLLLALVWTVAGFVYAAWRAARREGDLERQLVELERDQLRAEVERLHADSKRTRAGAAKIVQHLEVGSRAVGLSPRDALRLLLDDPDPDPGATDEADPPPRAPDKLPPKPGRPAGELGPAGGVGGNGDPAGA